MSLEDVMIELMATKPSDSVRERDAKNTAVNILKNLLTAQAAYEDCKVEGSIYFTGFNDCLKAVYGGLDAMSEEFQSQ